MPFIAATTDPAQALTGLGASLFPSPLAGAQANLLGQQADLTSAQTQGAQMGNAAAAAKAAATAALPNALNAAIATRNPQTLGAVLTTATAAGVDMKSLLGGIFAASSTGNNATPQGQVDTAAGDMGENFADTQTGQGRALAQSGANAAAAAAPGMLNAQTNASVLQPYTDPTTGQTVGVGIGQQPPPGAVPSSDYTSLANAKTAAAAATANLAQPRTYLQRNATGGSTAVSMPGNVVPPTGAVPYDANNPAASGQGAVAFGSQGGGDGASPLGNILFTDGNNPATSGQGGAQPAPGGPAPGVTRVPPTPSAPDPATGASLPPAVAGAGPTLAQTMASMAAGNPPTPSVAGPAAPSPTSGVTPSLAATVAPVAAPGPPGSAASVPDDPMSAALRQQMMTGPGGGNTPPNAAGLAAADWKDKVTAVDAEKNTGWFKGNPLQLSDQATTLLNAKAAQLQLTPQFRGNPAGARNEAWRLMSPGFTSQWHGVLGTQSAGPSLYGPPGSTLTPPAPDASAPAAAPTPQPAAPQPQATPQPTPAAPPAAPAAPTAAPVQQTVMQQMASLPAASRVTGKTYQFGNLKVTWNGSGWSPN